MARRLSACQSEESTAALMRRRSVPVLGVFSCLLYSTRFNNLTIISSDVESLLLQTKQQ